MNLQGIAASIPHYESFLTVDEMRASTAQLHAEFPALTSVRVVGATREDDPLELLSVQHREGLAECFPLWRATSQRTHRLHGHRIPLEVALRR